MDAPASTYDDGADLTAPCYWCPTQPRPCKHDLGEPLPKPPPLTSWMGERISAMEKAAKAEQAWNKLTPMPAPRREVDGSDRPLTANQHAVLVAWRRHGTSGAVIRVTGLNADQVRKIMARLRKRKLVT